MAKKFSRLYPMFVEWSALGSFVLLGDLAAQTLEHRLSKPTVSEKIIPTVPSISSAHTHEINDTNEFQLKRSRVLAAASTGWLFVAPICMVWFPFLHGFMARYFAHLVEGSLRYVFTKVMLENVFLAVPVCVGYFAIPAAVEGGDDWCTVLASRLENGLAPTLVTYVSFWGVVSPLNYKFMPVRLVVLARDVSVTAIVTVTVVTVTVTVTCVGVCLLCTLPVSTVQSEILLRLIEKYTVVFRYQPGFSCILGGVEATGLSFLAHRDSSTDEKSSQE